MANFQTHMLAAVGGGVVATSILASTDLLPVASVASGIGLVALGGIFPDVDSDQSDAITLVFDTLAVGVAVPLMIATVPTLGLLGSLALLAVVVLTIRYLVVIPFRALTVHRGRFHSLPMAVMLAGAIAIVSQRVLGQGPVQAWLMGGLFFTGFAIHLLLDEIYSVDLGNRRIKRSFGTAIKLFDRQDVKGYLGLYLVLGIVLACAPSPRPMVQAVAHVQVRWLPEAVAELSAAR